MRRLLEVATILYNAWCKEFEDKNCEGCPAYEFEEGWSCINHPFHPFYSKIDHVWYSITALKDHDKEVSKQDLFNAVDQVIRYLKKVIKETTKKP